MSAVEANFDGLVGPTHNYGGLSYGNIASARNLGDAANPRAAALQGLEKMKLLMDWGYVQGVLPPQERPDLHALKNLGFKGSDRKILEAASRYPQLLAACCSASSMWAANAATVSPSADTGDGRVHFTPANLVSKFHRALEVSTTSAILRATFPSREHFAHHRPLPPSPTFGDEGAANHSRIGMSYGGACVEMFVYGREGMGVGAPRPARFPARQTLEACEAVVRKHRLRGTRVVFAQQSPEAIDAGVFHNDVIAVANRNLVLCHERAWLNQDAVLRQLAQALKPARFNSIVVPESAVPLQDAVDSYLFNSQLLGRDDGSHWLLVPEECRRNPRVWEWLQQQESPDGPITRLAVVDVTQSMRNGGGPACLRLRVALKEEELAAVNPDSLLTPARYQTLVRWVEKHYRDSLAPEDLADPLLLQESRAALDELTGILGLGPVYRFQK